MSLQRSTRAVDVLVVLLISGNPVVHLTARISADLGELDRPCVAAWLWDALRGAFPEALAAAIMPDHPHVVTPCADPDSAVVRLNRLLGQLGRRLEVPGRSGIVAPARVISSQAELRRQLRYVALNAPRAGLVDCPLSWIWSTHRDVIGAIADPWVTSDRLAGALRASRPGFVLRYHAYVSADPSCDVSGTPLPEPVAPRTCAEIPLGRIVRAAAAATRSTCEDVRRCGPARTLFVLLAREQGWRSSQVLAEVCGCAPRTIRRLAALREPRLVSAGRLCLGDRRLLRTVEAVTRAA